MDEKQIKASIDDLYHMAFVKLLLPYLDLKAVSVQRNDQISFDNSLWNLSNIYGAKARRSSGRLTCEIPVYEGGSPRPIYFFNLARVILYDCSSYTPEARERRLRQDVYGNLRSMFNRHNHNKELQEVILEIIFQLGKRGYMDLVKLLDALLDDPDCEISGEIVAEIEQMIGLINPEGTDVKKKFEL